jgi:hypothetical protein
MIQIISKHITLLANDFKSLRLHSGRTESRNIYGCFLLYQKKYNFVYILDEEFWLLMTIQLKMVV